MIYDVVENQGHIANSDHKALGLTCTGSCPTLPAVSSLLCSSHPGLPSAPRTHLVLPSQGLLFEPAVWSTFPQSSCGFLLGVQVIDQISSLQRGLPDIRTPATTFTFFPALAGVGMIDECTALFSLLFGSIREVRTQAYPMCLCACSVYITACLQQFLSKFYTQCSIHALNSLR